MISLWLMNWRPFSSLCLPPITRCGEEERKRPGTGEGREYRGHDGKGEDKVRQGSDNARSWGHVKSERKSKEQRLMWNQLPWGAGLRPSTMTLEEHPSKQHHLPQFPVQTEKIHPKTSSPQPPGCGPVPVRGSFGPHIEIKHLTLLLHSIYYRILIEKLVLHPSIAHFWHTFIIF